MCLYFGFSPPIPSCIYRLRAFGHEGSSQRETSNGGMGSIRQCQQSESFALSANFRAVVIFCYAKRKCCHTKTFVVDWRCVSGKNNFEIHSRKIEISPFFPFLLILLLPSIYGIEVVVDIDGWWWLMEMQTETSWEMWPLSTHPLVIDEKWVVVDGSACFWKMTQFEGWKTKINNNNEKWCICTADMMDNNNINNSSATRAREYLCMADGSIWHKHTWQTAFIMSWFWFFVDDYVTVAASAMAN